MKLMLFTLLLIRSACAHEILTIAQPILDHVVFVSEQFLSTIPGEKGGREMVSEQEFSNILQSCGACSTRSPGGSSANVMKGLAQLGHDVAAIGKIGNDNEGFYYATELQRLGVSTYVLFSPLSTGKSAILVTPDGERTMRTALGAAADTSEFFLEETLFHNTALFHIEGYMLFDQNLVRKTLACIQPHDTLISMNLSSFEVARLHKDFILGHLKDHVDILFANQDEVRALTGLEPEEACNALAALFSVVVVTMGREGCWAQAQAERCQVPAFKVNTLDSTGAGDYFSSGFLHGYLNGYSLRDCCWIGNLVASQVVEEVGAHIPEKRWVQIRSVLKENGFTVCLSTTEEKFDNAS